MNTAQSDIIQTKKINIDEQTTYTKRTVLNGITDLEINAQVKSQSLILSGGHVSINAPLKVNGTLLIHAPHLTINADVQADYIGLLSDDLTITSAKVKANKAMLMDIQGTTSLNKSGTIKASKIFVSQETTDGLDPSIKVQVMDKPMDQYKELKNAVTEIQNFGPLATADLIFGGHDYDIRFNYHNKADSSSISELKAIIEEIFTESGLQAPWVMPPVAEVNIDETVTLPVEEAPILPVDIIMPPAEVVILPIKDDAVAEQSDAYSSAIDQTTPVELTATLPVVEDLML
ncbi:MAG: hypothetical protein JSS50_00740 [Proteobacteria bacterium]|nr:hypothetical protein [Pseudomonadota bacterium]